MHKNPIMSLRTDNAIQETYNGYPKNAEKGSHSCVRMRCTWFSFLLTNAWVRTCYILLQILWDRRECSPCSRNICSVNEKITKKIRWNHVIFLGQEFKNAQLPKWCCEHRNSCMDSHHHQQHPRLIPSIWGRLRCKRNSCIRAVYNDPGKRKKKKLVSDI